MTLSRSRSSSTPGAELCGRGRSPERIQPDTTTPRLLQSVCLRVEIPCSFDHQIGVRARSRIKIDAPQNRSRRGASAITRNDCRSSSRGISELVKVFICGDFSGRPISAGPSSSPIRASTCRCAPHHRPLQLGTAQVGFNSLGLAPPFIGLVNSGERPARVDQVAIE
jgi:hypothetical protein